MYHPQALKICRGSEHAKEVIRATKAGVRLSQGPTIKEGDHIDRIGQKGGACDICCVS